MPNPRPTAAAAMASAEAAQTLALALALLLLGRGIVSLAELQDPLLDPAALADIPPDRRPLVAAELRSLVRLLTAAAEQLA